MDSGGSVPGLYSLLVLWWGEVGVGQTVPAPKRQLTSVQLPGSLGDPSLILRGSNHNGVIIFNSDVQSRGVSILMSSQFVYK